MTREEAHLCKKDEQLLNMLEELRRILNISYEVDAGITMTYKKMVEICSKYGYMLKENN